MERVAVLALAYGGPDSLDQVEPFLRRIMAPREPSPDTVTRARERYSLIGGRSPLAENTRRQARTLEERLNVLASSSRGAGAPDARSSVFRVFVGMRHTSPAVGEALVSAAAATDRSVVVVILASHQSERATGGYLRDLASAFPALPPAERERLGKPLVVGSWHLSAPYLDAVAGRIEEAATRLASRGGGQRPVVMFTAHSLPLVAGRGDTDYEGALRATVEGVMARLPAGPPPLLAYQSASAARGGEWLGPDVGDEMRRLSREGMDRVVVMPLGFVSEHLETLFDLDIELAGVAAAAGVLMERAATVQDAPGLMDALAEAVFERLAGREADPAASGPPLEVKG